MPTASAQAARLAPTKPSGWREYVSVARLDHVTKHIFVLPGVLLAFILSGVHTPNIAVSAVLGLIVVVCVASANYTINEFLDRESDRHHPTKKMRAAVQTEMSGTIIFVQWLALVGIGVAAAATASATMLLVAIMFAAQGIVYNVRPLRTKDIAYLDVLSEAVNNPFRLMIGWVVIDPFTLPPTSVLLAYWFGGAFLMGAKRLSEYREIVAGYSKELLTLYRRSFAGYDEISLTASVFAYALLSTAFLGIFLIKYRVEYIITLPALILLFTKYLSLSMLPGSTAQKPERLFREGRLLMIVALVVALFVFSTFVDLPAIDAMASQRFTTLGLQ